MADALLKVLLTELSSLIKGELGLVIGFKKEFEKLSSTLSTIQCVIEDAQMKQLNDKALENWLKKLNAAAYEVDDIVDECKTEAVRFKQSRLWSYHPGIITFRYTMGKRMKKVMEKLDSIAEERIKFHLRERIGEQLNAFVGHETGHVLREKEVFGREKEENDIMKILLTQFSNSEELSVLPIVGMGGLGKTTLAQKIFKDERVTTHFKIKIWVCVSVDFDEKRLLKKIVECIEGSSAGVDDLAPLQTKVQSLLDKKRYFLVLDDVWNEDQVKWANVRAVLNVGAKGASVLVTTRGHTVGSIVQTVTTYQLSSLSEDDCWLVFKECAAPGQERELDPDLVGIGKEIVKKCGGVPLAAKSLGSLLRFKREEREWKKVRDSEIWDLEQDETSILPALRLSYHHLPLHLRHCFTYCAVFPKDTLMEKNNLIRLWMAHGFLSSKGKLELEGNEVWNELYQRSFFQEVEVVVNEFGERTYFKMHDLIHDLATLLMSTNSSNCKIRQLAVKTYWSDFISIDGFSKVISSYTPSLLKGYASLRVLNLRRAGLKELPSSIGDLIHLRLLDLSGNREIKTLPKRLCKLQNLQTLNLEYCVSLSCLPKQISKLSSLRVLLLEGCQCLKFMPPRIGELTCLKILDYFVVGEREGSQLGELRNLDLHGLLRIEHLERVKNDMDAKEANLSSKENISTLSMRWMWPDEDECESDQGLDDKVFEALAPHPNLKLLKIENLRGSCLPKWMNGSVLRNVVKIEMKDCFRNCVQLPPFGELPRLEILNLSDGYAEYVEDNVDDCGRFPSLRKLHIRGFPNLKGLMKKEGKEHFPILEDIVIEYCPEFVFQSLACVKKLKVMDNTTLSSISCLTTLTFLTIDFHDATSLPEDMFKSLAYLQDLTIRSCQNLKELPTSLASHSALKNLHIRFCDELQSLPTTISEMKNLQHLEIESCPLLEKHYEKEVGKECHKIAHIPNVKVW